MGRRTIRWAVCNSGAAVQNPTFLSPNKTSFSSAGLHMRRISIQTSFLFHFHLDSPVNLINQPSHVAMELLSQFYGYRILIDGQDIHDATLFSLRNQIGLVTQNVVTFNDTISANIAYGRPEATREEIIAAAERAFAHEFISPLPDGYDTLIGEYGSGFSGGYSNSSYLSTRPSVRSIPPNLGELSECARVLDVHLKKKAAKGNLGVSNSAPTAMCAVILQARIVRLYLRTHGIAGEVCRRLYHMPCSIVIDSRLVRISTRRMRSPASANGSS